MVNGVMFLASYGSFGGGVLGDLFAQWEAAGVFTYLLPLLLIFALVFGLLSKLNIFASKDNENKGVNVIIALATAFMAMQFNMVSVFFSEVFPRFGIALSVILVILILGGLFMPTNKESNWFMVVLAIIVFIIIGVVLYNSFGAYGFGSGGSWFSYIWAKFGPLIIIGVLFIAAISFLTRGKNPKRPQIDNILLRSLNGN